MNDAVEHITLESSCRKIVKGLCGFRLSYFDEIQEAFMAVPCSNYSASLVNSVQESETFQCESLNRSTRSKQKEEVLERRLSGQRSRRRAGLTGTPRENRESTIVPLTRCNGMGMPTGPTRTAVQTIITIRPPGPGLDRSGGEVQ